MIVVLAPVVCREVIYGIDRLRPGQAQRAHRVVERLAGKGVNVARFCGAMGVPVRLVAIADEASAAALGSDPHLRASELVHVPTAGVPRTDAVCVEPGGRSTVVNGIGGDCGPEALDAAEAGLLAGLAADDVVVLPGSVPPDARPDLYARLATSAAAAGAAVIIDTSGLWLRSALPAGPSVLKATAHELAEASGARPWDAWRDPRLLAPEPGSIVLTAGRRGARVWAEGTAWAVSAPAQPAVNTIGAGDALTAGLAAGLADARPLLDAVVDGVAWAAARVHAFDLELDPSLARDLRPGVRISRLTASGRS